MTELQVLFGKVNKVLYLWGMQCFVGISEFPGGHYNQDPGVLSFK